MASPLAEPTAIPRAHEAIEYLTTSTIKLHPLVLVNITDQFTRLNVEEALNPNRPKGAAPAPLKRAIGALIGQQDSRATEIHTSFEVLYTEEKNGTIKIDLEFMRNKMIQYHEVFPDYEVVGWYTTGAGLSKTDILETNRAVAEEFCDTPIVLVMDTNPGPDVKSLPVYLFESVSAVIGNVHMKAQSVRKVRYQVESEESERIGIDTAMKVDFASEKNPTLAPQCSRLASAVSMLRSRLLVVVAYLKDVRAKKIAPDYELLRQICTVCNQLPCAESPSFTKAVGQDYHDAVLVTLMATVTKATLMLERVVEKSGVFSASRRQAAMGLGSPAGVMF